MPPDLAGYPICLEGAWSATRPRRWEGRATGPCPLAAVLFLGDAVETAWCKTSKAPDGIIGLVFELLGHGGQASDVNVCLGSASAMLVRRALLPAGGFQPDIAPSALLETGRMHCIAELPGGNGVRATLLLLSAADIRVGRNKLWHLRPDAAAAFAASLSGALLGGRSGKMGTAALCEAAGG